jgi:hypothetical protein
MITHTLGDMIMTDFAKRAHKAKREHAVAAQIHNFLATPKEYRSGLCTFGVEIEYQQDDGDWLDDLDFEDRYDTDHARRDARDKAINDVNDCPEDYIGQADLAEWLHDTVKSTRSFIKALFENSDEDVEDTIKDHAFLFDDPDDLWIDTVDRVTDSNYEYTDWSEYEYDHDTLRDYHGGNTSIDPNHADVEWDSDCSVTGGELRTIGGLSYDDLTDAAEAIFEAIDDGGGTIDARCSAHIHLKLGDVRHRYGTGSLYRHMMEYVIDNFDRLPLSVQERLECGGNGNIRPRQVMGNTKCSWIHFHGRENTIEFRLFGNIDNLTDLERCVDLALDCLAYGYTQITNDGEHQYHTSYLYERILGVKPIEDYGLFDAPGQQYMDPLGPPAFTVIDWCTNARTLSTRTTMEDHPDYVPTFVEACTRRRDGRVFKGLDSIGLRRDTWRDINWPDCPY